jgi:iron complex transport system substrate-binding protein
MGLLETPTLSSFETRPPTPFGDRDRDTAANLDAPFTFTGWVDFPPCVNRLIGLWWLAKILYPAQFPEDIRPLTRDFYQRFYHVTPNDAQIERVLAGRG